MNRKLVTVLLTLALAVSCSVSVFAASFKDVKDPSWYSESVNYVVKEGYMAGMSEDTFAPNGLVTRAQLTQILFAAEGKPEVKGESSFTDVPSTGKWYSSAILWGAKNAIVAGYPDKTFRPNQAVTREQLVSVMYKYAIFKEYAEANDGGAMGLAGYSDADQVASYARPGMLWAVQNKIVSGTNVGLEPKGFATRAQMAVIIKAFMTNVAKGEETPDDSKNEDESGENKDGNEDPADPSPSVNPSAPSEDETHILPEDDTNAPEKSSDDSSGSNAGADSPSSDDGSGNESSSRSEDETPLVPA